MYSAQYGKGAHKIGVRLDLTKTPLAKVAYCKGRFFEALDAILAPMDVTCENGPQGGGYGFTMVADGSAAARFNLLGGGYTHDYAPGALLISEAGGAIIPFKDDIYTYQARSFVVCHPDLEPVLRPHAKEIRNLEIALVGQK